MSTFDVKHEESDTKGRFFLVDDQGKTAAESTYSKAGTDKIIIDHTEVSDALRGTGAGQALIEAAVAHARAKGIKILPLCPFARAVIAKNKHLQDVV